MLLLIRCEFFKKSYFIGLKIKSGHKNRLKVNFALSMPVTFIRGLIYENQIKYNMPTKAYFPKNITFFGTDKFSVISLQSLLLRKREGLISRLCIVTSPQKSTYPAVPKFCNEYNISYEEWPLSSPIQGFDLGIVVSFGYLIPQSVIESFPLGIINVHGSLLPRWRGSSPIIHAVLNRDKEAGITIMRIRPHKFDVGEILYQEKVPIHNEKSAELTNKMAVLGAKCLIHCLANFPAMYLEAKPQPSDGVTSALKIKETDSRIIWEKMTPDLIHAMFLAFDDYHHLWSIWHGQKVKLKAMSNWHNEGPSTFHTDQCMYLTTFRYIKKIRSSTAEKNEAAIEEEITERSSSASCVVSGQVLYMKKEKVLRIKCLYGHVDFQKIAVQGKRTMTALEFYNGYLSKVNFVKRFFR